MNSRRPAIRYCISAFAGLLALAVLFLAWPRLKAHYRFLPVEIAIDRYFANRQIPSGRLPTLIRYAHDSIQLHDHYRFHDGLSILHLLRAEDFQTPALERRNEYEEAALEAEASLKSSPAQSATWLRLAMIRWILREEPADVISAWKMSIFTGRNHSSIIIQRMEIGLAFRSSMDEEGVAMLRDQLLLAWRLHPGSLIRVLHARDRKLTVTAELIADSNTGEFEEMEAWIERIR